jgi:hypothetical protein
LFFWRNDLFFRIRSSLFAASPVPHYSTERRRRQAWTGATRSASSTSLAPSTKLRHGGRCHHTPSEDQSSDGTSPPSSAQDTTAGQYSIFRKASDLRVVTAYLDPVLYPVPRLHA